MPGRHYAIGQALIYISSGVVPSRHIVLARRYPRTSSPVTVATLRTAFQADSKQNSLFLSKKSSPHGAIFSFLLDNFYYLAEKVYYKLCNGRYKLSNTCYKLCNTCYKVCNKNFLKERKKYQAERKKYLGESKKYKGAKKACVPGESRHARCAAEIRVKSSLPAIPCRLRPTSFFRAASQNNFGA